jgi:glycine cleavage system H lipoate-binding protein
MFPWTDGFHWTATHIIFLSLFFAALAIIVSTVIFALWRAGSDFRKHRAAAICWRDNFAELPEAERHCRHQLAGRVESRICDNAFDCRTCPNYANFAVLPAKVSTKNVGVCYSDKLLYHRGHTWVRREWDGTYAVGLDEFAIHLIGQPDSVELPALFEEMESEGIAWTMIKNGHKVQVRAPLSGTVVSTGGPEKGWFVKILPHGEPNLRHLLSGPEVPGWLASEIGRLQLQLSSRSGGPCLPDGGMLMPELMDAEPKANWDAVLASTFLDS